MLGSRPVPRSSATAIIATAASCALALSLAFGAGPASASTQTIVCNHDGGTPSLQAALTGATDSETIIIDGLCTGSFTVPTGVSLTIEGQSGTTSGFDGSSTAQTGALLSAVAVGVPSQTLELEDLVFENAVTPSSPGPSALDLEPAAGLTVLAGDTFTNNQDAYPGTGPGPNFISEGAGGCSAADGSLSITGTAFTLNTFSLDDPTVALASPSADAAGGAGLDLYVACPYDPVTLTDNQFTGNTLAAASGGDGLGGGLGIFNVFFPSIPAPVMQIGNVFDSNAVAVTGTPLADYGGGGEWTEGIDLQSAGDRFSRNTLPGTNNVDESNSPYPNWAWGAGLSILNEQCVSGNTASSLTQDVVAANSIDDVGGDVPADALGAGIYLGCGGPTSGGNNLSLYDSTVTENSVTGSSAVGPVAGIFGDATDHLTLDNTIVYGDSGGAEYGGFTGGGTLLSTFSDFCSGSSPYTGTGDICADPMLTDDGNLSSFDVHETASSPTIDAGSNTLVPAGLTSDFYNAPREVNGTNRLTCPATPTSGTVDIGAAEYQPVCLEPQVARRAACTSRRDFLIHLHFQFDLPPDAAITHVLAKFGTRKVDLHGTNITVMRINMRGLKKGAYRVSVTATVSGYPKLHRHRLFHTCAPTH